ncbi:MAG: efflux RND transporter periplasmic adaptor subunit [Gemmatimonadaceae bacterium]|nr:efflux RND transporter periplasmic adaptor subunit [Gemmatimonadaceae bacterium]
MKSNSLLVRRDWRVVPVLLVSAVLAACGGDKTGAASVDSAAVASASVDNDAANATLTLGARDVAPVVSRAVASGVEVTGSLDPAERVEIKAQIAGQLGRVSVERGTAVRRGQVLTAFESGAMRAQVASAEAALAARERDLVAIDTLYKRGAASQQDFVNAGAARDAARAQLAQARETLDRANIISPIGGQVSEKIVSSGEAVQSGARLFTIVNADELELAGHIAAVDAARVRVGLPVRLTLESYPGRTLNGRVDRVDPVADPATRQVTVYIRVDNRRERVVAGLFATGRIQVSASTSNSAAANDKMLAVPVVAVRTEGKEQVVYVVDGTHLRRQVVTVGARDSESGLIEIRSGLTDGAMVLVAPGGSPRDAMPVRIASTGGNPS